MALDQKDMEQRREKREMQKKKQERDRMRMKIAMMFAALILLAVGVGIYRMAAAAAERSREREAAELAEYLSTAPTDANGDPILETEPVETEAVKSRTTTIHLRAAGDLNITDATVNAGLSATGFDFTRAFLDVSAELAAADITVLNLEGNICGEPYGTETASAPTTLLTALRNAGVDLIQMANSYSVNNGLIGLSTTLTNIRQSGMEPLGAYASAADFQSSKGYTICEVEGIRIAFVSFTKGLGGMGLPAGNEYCVNLLYTDYDSTYKTVDTDAINTILNAVAAEKPDITVAMLHWGSENNDEISSTQTKIISLMQKKGVDIIIGTHPHLVQEIDYDETAGTLVAYSLGDFFGDATHSGTDYSIILDVEITKDSETESTRVTGFDYIPIYTLKQTETVDGFRRVMRIEAAMYAYENNFVDKCSQSTYAQMAYSLQRIEARVSGNG